MFDKIIEETKENILSTVADLIKIPSVSNETGNEEYPFGKECTKALEFILTVVQNYIER